MRGRRKHNYQSGDHMNLQELLEKDRERLLASLHQAGTPDQAVPVIESEYDRMLYEYNEQCGDDFQRRCASMILQSARMSAPLLDSIGETKIWEQGGKLVSGEIRKVRVSSVVMTTAGVIMIAASIIVLAGTEEALNKMFSSPAIAAALILGLVLLFLGGLFLRKTTKASYSEKELKAEPRIDADRIYRTLHAVVLVADRNIEEALSARKLEAEKSGQPEQEDKTDLALYSDLLEAQLARDGEYALDQISKVPFYLHQKGIEAVEYSEEHRSWFDVIPGERQETIRPALVKDGQLLKKGIVSGDY